MLDNLLAIALVIAVILVTYLLKKIGGSEPNKIKYYFKFFLFYFYGSTIACFLWPFFILRPKNVDNAELGAWLIKPITKVIGLKWQLRNGERFPDKAGAVVISNHQSSLDILGLFNIWDKIGKLAPVAKKEIFYVWPFGLAAYLAGVVFINRNNKKGAYEQLQITSKVMVEKKTKIWLFPEGTRNKDCSKLLPFKKGAFAIAIAAQRPIVPVVFSPYYFINEDKYIFNEGHIIVQCLEPVSTDGMTMEDLPQLVEQVKNKMEKMYIELTKEVFSSLPAEYPINLVQAKLVNK